VLKIHVVHEGRHHYYLEGLVPGRAEGTLVAGEDPGTWSGSAAGTLGLAGRVEAASFAEVMAGRDPGSGRPLRARAGDGSVAAYDLSFCAPKSVSLVHLLAPREVAVETGAGHRAAVAEAAAYLERSALAVRRRDQGRDDMLPTTGGVAGGFLHRTSRALDPHLHTHLVVANAAQGVDGRWSALDSRRLHTHLQAAQGIYHARLRLELTVRFGAAWEVGPGGLGDLVGVPSELRHLFSQRSADMARFEYARHGRLGRRYGRGAFHSTRQPKEAGPTVEDLRREWRSRAADFGYDLGDLTRVVGLGGRERDQPPIDLDDVGRRLDRATRDQRPLAHHDLVALLSASSVAGARAESIEALAASLAEAAGPPCARGGGPSRCAATGREVSRWRAEELRRALDGGIHPKHHRERRADGRRPLERAPRDLEPEIPGMSLGRAR
jgi:conjugative relaxase-like TrwC/TraI family protein